MPGFNFITPLGGKTSLGMGSLCYGPYMLPLFAICALSPGARKFACKRVDCVFLCKCICASEKVLCFRTSVPELFNPAHYRLRSAKLQAAALGGSHCAIAEKHEVLPNFSFLHFVLNKAGGAQGASHCYQLQTASCRCLSQTLLS